MMSTVTFSVANAQMLSIDLFRVNVGLNNTYNNFRVPLETVNPL